MRASSLLLAGLLLGSCAQGNKDPGTDTVDPCEPAPTNWSPDTAAQLLPDEDNAASYCRISGKSTLYFKLPGAFAPRSQWRLRVTYDRGSLAEDLDFRFGVPSGGDVTARAVVGSCRQPAGQSEDCVVELPAAAMDHVELRVLGSANGDAARAENFKIRITKYKDAPTDGGM